MYVCNLLVKFWGQGYSQIENIMSFPHVIYYIYSHCDKFKLQLDLY